METFELALKKLKKIRFMRLLKFINQVFILYLIISAFMSDGATITMFGSRSYTFVTVAAMALVAGIIGFAIDKITQNTGFELKQLVLKINPDRLNEPMSLVYRALLQYVSKLK